MSQIMKNEVKKRRKLHKYEIKIAKIDKSSFKCLTFFLIRNQTNSNKRT